MKRTVLSVALLLLPFVSCKGEPPLPVYGTVPQWSLQSSSGDEVGLDDLRDRVVVYDFIYTRCAASCPMMTARMGDLVSKLRSDEIRFVSISVDPEWDTPEVLAEYRAKVTSDDRWIFLTGEREEIRDLSVEGFLLAADTGGNPESGPVVHSSRFVLVDRNGTIRGYYDALSREVVASLETDVKALLRD